MATSSGAPTTTKEANGVLAMLTSVMAFMWTIPITAMSPPPSIHTFWAAGDLGTMLQSLWSAPPMADTVPPLPRAARSLSSECR